VKITYYELMLGIMTEFDEFYKRTENLFGGRMPYYKEFLFGKSYLSLPTMHVSKTDEELRSLLESAFHLYAMKKCGAPMYEIEEGLAHQLLHTRLNVDTFFLKSPFTEIMLAIPHGLFKIPDISTGAEVWVENIYVHFRDDIEGYKQVQVFATNMTWIESEVAGWLSGTDGGMWDDTIFFFDVALKSGKKVDDALKEVIDNIKWGDGIADQQGKDRLDIIFRFVFNTLLYLTSRDAEIIKQLPVNYMKQIKSIRNPNKNRKKIERLKVLARESTSKSYMYITKKNAPIVSSEPGEYRDRQSRYKLLSKQMVSGFWRIQWSGPRKNQFGAPQKGERYQLIFIDPFERGLGRESKKQIIRKVK
jgi:hypothetical protein